MLCFSERLTISKTYRVKSSSEISFPQIFIRSLYLKICGLVKRPVLIPAAERIEDKIAQTEPFPLVPAT